MVTTIHHYTEPIYANPNRCIKFAFTTHFIDVCRLHWNDYHHFTTEFHVRNKMVDYRSFKTQAINKLNRW